MKDSTLLKIGFSITIIGLILLFFLRSSIKEISSSQEIEYSNTDLDKTIQVSGTITNMIEKKGIAIIQLAKDERITVVVFTESQLPLNKGSRISVSGKVKIYNGEYEVVADEISII